MNYKYRWIGVVGVLVTAGPIFAAFLYLMGRRYTEGYFTAVGLPSSQLVFETSDYIYRGAHWVTISVAFVFAALAYLLGRFLFSQSVFSKEVTTKLEPKERKTWEQRLEDILKNKLEREVLFAVLYMLWVAIGVALMAFLEIFEHIPNVGIAALMFVYVLSAGGFGIMLLSDKSIISHMRQSNWLRNMVLVSCLLVLLLMPYLCAGAWGDFRGSLDIKADHISKTFGTVVFTSDQPVIKEFQWERTTQGFFQTKDKLYLLLENNERLFVRPEGNGNQTVVVPINSLSSYSLNFRSPWELPKSE